MTDPIAPPADRAAATPAAPSAGVGPLKWAADLLRKLGETGTGADKLAVLRAAMRAKFDGPDVRHLDGRDARRHLTAAEGVAALEADLRVGEGTVRKARAVAEFGEYVPAAAGAVTPGENLLPPPPADESEQPAEAGADRAEPADDEGEGDDGLEALTVPELKALAADRGVHPIPDRKAEIIAALRAKK